MSKSVGAVQGPDAHLIALIGQAQQLTEAWAKRHDLWYDSCHRDPIVHYQDDPGVGGPILLLCSDGPAMSVLQWDESHARELRDELEQIGIYLEFDDNVTACYHLIDNSSSLQKEFDHYTQWRWICQLIEADSEDVTGDLYQYFTDNPDDFHRLPHREFEKLVSSIFAAQGWKTELGPGSGDNGVDLRLWQTDPLGDILTLVQIKRYAPHLPIHLEAVAALESHVNREGANRGLFVTSSRYLPGVKTFAERNKHRLQLAEPDHLMKWCRESAYAAKTATNRALAMQSFGPLIAEIRNAGTHPSLVVASSGPDFCVVLRKTRTSAILVHIPNKSLSDDLPFGLRIPLLNGEIQASMYGTTVFRAICSEKNGDISYWGERTLFHIWDGRPCAFDYWD